MTPYTPSVYDAFYQLFNAIICPAQICTMCYITDLVPFSSYTYINAYFVPNLTDLYCWAIVLSTLTSTTSTYIKRPLHAKLQFNPSLQLILNL